MAQDEEPKEINPNYWNGKTSDLPILQQMIRRDNEAFQIGKNKFEEAE